MLVVDNIEQGSEAWHRARLGIPTASRFKDIITDVTCDYSASSKDYINELIYELDSGDIEENYKSYDMLRGSEMEDEAIAAYETETGLDVERVGLVYANDKKDILCSPDGLVLSRSRGLEAKCPKGKTFVRWVLEGGLPAEHRAQVQGSMYVTSCDEWDFLAYHPEYNPFIITVKRDDDYIQKLQKCLIRFKIDFNEAWEKFHKKNGD